MKKIEVYQDSHSHEFRFKEETHHYSDLSKITKLAVYFNSNTLVFTSPEEVDEFCELLQEKKKEIWKS